jgi:hypothetical protein
MALDKNLFKGNRQKKYDIAKTAVDNRKNLGNDYSKNILTKSLSGFIFRNALMDDFIALLQTTVSMLVDSVAYLKSYKSYTTKKQDNKFR